MKRLVLVGLAVLALAGCRAGTAPGDNVAGGMTVTGTEAVQYVHDTKRGVGCWIYVSSDNTSISCLPDSQYTAE